MNILFEDNHILVCEKPAGIASQAGRVTDKDMVSEVNNYLRRAGAKASAYLIHRLDKPVRGILVFAKTKAASAELNKQLTDGLFCKKYYAIVEGRPENDEGVLENYLYKDNSQNKALVDVGREIEESKLAKLEYKVIEKYHGDEVRYINDEQELYLLDIHLLTGRFHQIRCQLSFLGNPIAGDSLYGSVVSCKKRNTIALIAYSLSFNHPMTGKLMSFSLPAFSNC